MVLGCVNPPICQALPADALEGLGRALVIINAQRNAVIGPEIKLSQIALQVLFAAMLVGANHAALKDREKALQRVGMDFAVLALADIFLVVVNALMGRDGQRELVSACAVGMEGCG